MIDIEGNAAAKSCRYTDWYLDANNIQLYCDGSCLVTFVMLNIFRFY